MWLKYPPVLFSCICMCQWTWRATGEVKVRQELQACRSADQAPCWVGCL